MKKVLTCLLVICAVLGVIGAPKRVKCKSPTGCKDFADPGQSFCEKHRCNSYGCKEHRATLTEPGWVAKAHYSRSSSYSFSSSYSMSTPRKICPPYCKKHMCQRVLSQWPNGTYVSGYSSSYGYHHSSSSSSYNSMDRNEALARYYYCANERLASGKYCLEHACKVPSCSAMKWESYVQVEGSSEQVRLDVGETCKAHSARDPDSIPERTGKAAMTCGERLRQREESIAAKAAEKE